MMFGSRRCAIAAAALCARVMLPPPQFARCSWSPSQRATTQPHSISQQQLPHTQWSLDCIGVALIKAVQDTVMAAKSPAVRLRTALCHGSAGSIAVGCYWRWRAALWRRPSLVCVQPAATAGCRCGSLLRWRCGARRIRHVHVTWGSMRWLRPGGCCSSSSSTFWVAAILHAHLRECTCVMGVHVSRVGLWAVPSSAVELVAEAKHNKYKGMCPRHHHSLPFPLPPACPTHHHCTTTPALAA
jgi:hypothetical protein